MTSNLQLGHMMCDRSKKNKTKEFGKTVFEIMSKLSYQDRAILSLRYIEGMNVSEIAYALNSSYLGVYISLFKAKRLLKKQLASVGFRKGFLPAIKIFEELTDDHSTIVSMPDL